MKSTDYLHLQAEQLLGAVLFNEAANSRMLYLSTIGPVQCNLLFLLVLESLYK